MPAPAADRPAARTPKALATLAAAACAACCLLPGLIAAGIVGTSAGKIVGWLPAIALALAVLAGTARWLGRRRTVHGCGSTGCGQGGCGCSTTAKPEQIIPFIRR